MSPSLSPPSFPRKRESRGLRTQGRSESVIYQRAPSYPKIKHESRATNPFPPRSPVILAKAGIQRFANARETQRAQYVSARLVTRKPSMNRERQISPPSLSPPSFPRKRESRGLRTQGRSESAIYQRAPSHPETKRESRATNLFPLALAPVIPAKAGIQRFANAGEIRERNISAHP